MAIRLKKMIKFNKNRIKINSNKFMNSNKKLQTKISIMIKNIKIEQLKANFYFIFFRF